jgi:hopanoid biosynthesis associated RND transporter like protein HpnN
LSGAWMTKKGNPKEYGRKLLNWWVRFVQRRALAVLVISFVMTAGILVYSVKHFSIDSDITDMISEKLPFRKLEKDFSRAFPSLTNTLVVVIDADSAERAIGARNRLAAGLEKEKNLFKSVYEPGGGAFFERNGLLYMSVDELQNFADNMSAAQPLLALISRNLSLEGLFSVVDRVAGHPGEEALNDKRIDRMYKEMGRAFDNASERKPYDFPWQGIMLGDRAMAGQQRQFMILQPLASDEGLSGGGKQIDAIRALAGRLGLSDTAGVRVRITGDVALAYENMKAVSDSMGLATLASLLLVSLIIYIGLGRSGRLIFSSLATLLMGLIWTTGFAIAFVGSLNMISITFAVLYIGLGIDYGIQFCLRYKEMLQSGSGAHQEGIILDTAIDVGMALFLSCVTTAIGFYSFIPTAYAGVAQLGVISGTGMFISFLATVTLLPAFLTVFPLGETPSSEKADGRELLSVPYRFSKVICAGSLVLIIVSALFIPRLHFDYNPLNLYNRTSESVTTAKDLFKDAEASPWTSSIVVRGAKEAQKFAGKLAKLREVKMALTIFGFVPDHQREKLAIISDIALFMPPHMDRVVLRHAKYAEDMRALNMLQRTLKKSLSSSGGDNGAAQLYKSIARFKESLEKGEGKKSFDLLENNLLSNLPGLFHMLNNSLNASAFNISDLPADLVSQYVSADGRYRVQVFPSENLTDNKALVRFVNAVRGVAPDATDSPVTIYESGRAIISSFDQATLYAVIAITVVLLFESGSFAMTFFVLVPLIVAMLLTAASSVLLGIPLNFANVIVVPLLLGMGVHSGLIYILRYRTAPPADGNMLRTSTASSVLYSALTTMVSTGSLAFASHRGIAGIGILLTLCLGFLIVSTLVMLPAVMNLWRRPEGGREKVKRR